MLRVLVPAFVLQFNYRGAQTALNLSLSFLPLPQYSVIPRHEITARDAHNPLVFPVMGTWLLSVLQVHLYIYSLSVKLFATVSPHCSLKFTSHQPSATGKIQRGGRMDVEAKEIQYLAQGCSGGECSGLAQFSWALVREGACGYLLLWQSPRDCHQLGREGNSQLSREIRAADLLQFPGVLSLQAGAVPCSSSISWLNGALTAAFLLSVMSTGSTAQLH